MQITKPQKCVLPEGFRLAALEKKKQTPPFKKKNETDALSICKMPLDGQMRLDTRPLMPDT